MKIFCGTFNCWIYHRDDPSLICNNRAKRFPESQRCKGVEISKPVSSPKEDPILKMITLNVDKDKWMGFVKGLQEEYEIREGSKKDPVSSRRIAILLGEAFIINFRDTSEVIWNVPIVEKDTFDLAMEYRLTCSPLEREARKMKKEVLACWGIDKTSGLEGYTTQLKEWTLRALFEEKEERAHGEPRAAGNVDGSRVIQNHEPETERAAIFAGRERNALRPVVQDEARLP